MALLITLLLCSHSIEGFSVFRNDYAPMYNDYPMASDGDYAYGSWDNDRVVRSEHGIDKSKYSYV